MGIKQRAYLIALGAFLAIALIFVLAGPRNAPYPYGKYVYGKYFYSKTSDDNNSNKDSDGDGLSDITEEELGTDPNNPDTDGDGNLDGQEILDETNPLDKGSRLKPLPATMCTEWNGFLDGMWNILEHVNLSVSKLNISDQLYSITGEALGKTSFSIEAGLQVDALVHDFNGYTRDSYGKVCISHSGQSGDLDGRMVYYKTEKGYPETSNRFEFALALPLSGGNTGRQYLLYNTYQPSSNPKDKDNLVANWIQVTNLNNFSISGTLKQYSMTGDLLRTININLGPSERSDIAAHEIGRNKVGLIEWTPNESNAFIQARNIRYLYNNPEVKNDFDTAFQLDGQYGTGDLISVPFDTSDSQVAVIEVANVLDSPIDVKVLLSSGNETKSFEINIPAHASQHIITNSYFNANALGLATIDGSKLSSVLAVAMQYRYGPSGSIDYMYGLTAEPPLGVALKGSHNTYLDQESSLILNNPSNITQKGILLASRQDGTDLNFEGSKSKEVRIPALSFLKLNLRQYAGPDNYGVLTFVPENKNSVSGYVLRKRNDEFVIPTALSK